MFPGKKNVGTEDGHATIAEQRAGSYYQYNTSSDSYEYRSTSVPCFVEGTLIATPNGELPIELLKIGDGVLTKDNGAQPIR